MFFAPLKQQKFYTGFLIVSLLIISLLLVGCNTDRSFDARLNSIVKPYLFGIAGWEFKAIPQEIGQWLSGGQEEVDDEIRIVIEYYDYVKRIKSLKSEIELVRENNEEAALSSLQDELSRLEEERTALIVKVESIIEKQIRDTLAEQGIFNPAGGSESTFPPVKFRLEQLPSVLVISPIDRIESIREYTLKPGLIRSEKESIEERVDELEVSSLVTEIGGIATYPSLVDSQTSLRYAIDTVIEEWLHQYLAFKPLGFRYVLDLTGISRDYEIVTINETLADMVGDEMGSIVYEKYYSGYENSSSNTSVEGFDFDGEMREIRKAVDEYLIRGEIEQAEEFMEEKRQYLVSEGHYIRKLNQAYFAFHGAYADRPAFENPIGVELRELRNRSKSLKDFLDTAAAMTSRQDLKASIR
ncbi:hypothetical protein ACFLTB_05665 [Chloroflexota bacterium]